MAVPKITEAEWAVMEAVWEKHPRTSTGIVEALRSTGWSPTTVRTLLARLVKKKALAAVKEGGVMVYQPRAAREACVAAEAESFIERILGGSLQPLVAHFVERGRLSPAELAELKRLIREAEQKS
jgi:predicted transcriptional regulator